MVDSSPPLSHDAGPMPSADPNHMAESSDPRFRRKLLNVVLVPAGLMLAVSVLLVLQIARLLRDSDLVAHSDLVLSRAFDLQKVTIDLETGLRGYLLTGEDRFLAPYRAGLAHVRPDTDDLRYRTRGRTDQEARTDVIAERRDRWLAYAERVVPDARAPATRPTATVALVAEGKQLMDSLRAAFADLLTVEEKLRDDRSAAARSAATTTFALVGVIAVVGGGLLALLARRQVVDITGTYQRAITAAEDANARLERRVADRTAELAAANGQLGEMNKELEAFAYSVSHDLRAPMRHITGFADLLKTSLGKSLSTDDAENLATIHDTAKLAGRMVDDLLGFSRVGRVALAVSTVDVAELAEQCRRELAPDVGDRSIAWSIRPVDPVSADPALLRLVLRNLLGNAVKYTGKRADAKVDVGPASWPVSAGDVAAAGRPGAVTFAVTDNGVGFDMAYAPKLFGVFQRLHRSEEFEGTGIGLANVKRIVQRLGGDVWAYGVPGGGATFYVCLPPATAGGAAAVGRPSALPAASTPEVVA